jgi:hypothetical protein
MRSIRTVFVLLAILTGLFFNTAEAASQKKDSDAVKLLFVVEVKSAALAKIGKNKYQLAVPLKNIRSVLAFAHNSYEVSHKMQFGEYDRMHLDMRSFDKERPNVIIAWSNHASAPAAYVVTGYKKTKNTLLYYLNSSKISSAEGRSIQEHKGKMVLFLDDMTLEGKKPNWEKSWRPMEALCRKMLEKVQQKTDSKQRAEAMKEYDSLCD